MILLSLAQTPGVIASQISSNNNKVEVVVSGTTSRGHTMAPEAQKPSQWPCLTKLPSDMCS
jgi:hypothetical protein